MKIAIIDKKDVTLKTQNNIIILEETKFPFKLVDTIVVLNNLKIDSKDIIKINENGISIIFFNSYSNKSSIAFSAASRNADLKQKQYNALSNRIQIAKYIVEEKLKRHIHQLKCNDISIQQSSYIEKIALASSIETLLGIEGSFAREYFKHYFELFPKKFHKGTRSKRPPLDPVNACLSYLYNILYNLITVKLLSYGFEPSISYLHTPFRDHNALSSDVLELFRDQVNQFVIFIFLEQIININNFQKKGGVYLNYEGKRALHKPLQDLWNGIDGKINQEITKLRSMLC